ncbi:MAG: glycoside hydrolase family 9 protein [Bacteroides sp.]|nr:glycoside hydrolase family 9 protein [Eubacterium sp.]MCM1419267.1 glycoside hydrolase family 9 protein [Roseburia sp.]MCM1461384.1 glycoside hydrolase family 9 protein [Bacteroides sp.]
MDNNYFDRTGATPRVCPFGIYVNQAGYPPNGKKRAILPDRAGRTVDFSLVDEDGNVCYTGTAVGRGFDPLSGDEVYAADFSDFREPGVYRLVSGERRSARFTIGEGVYKPLFDGVVKAYYFLRCGCELSERHAGVYRHAPCHLSPARLWDDRGETRDVSGGWHDAGDYGRYTTAGAVSVAHLLYAYRLFPSAFLGQEIGLPEDDLAGKLPAILSECRYELEWLLKMQREDGAVYHKLTSERHAPFVMPEEDQSEFFLFAPSSMATADFAAVAALASAVYRPYDESFAERLKAAALRSYGWLDDNSDFIGFKNPPECNTGVYGERDDRSNRFWAGAQLYALTGERRFHDDLVRFYERDFPRAALGYTELGGLGALAYLFADGEKDEALAEKMRSAFLGEAEYYRVTADRAPYGAAIREQDFHWGGNMSVMAHGMTFAIADVLLGEPRYRDHIAAQLDYLLGVNATGYSFITGYGEFCCNNPHHRPSFADGVDEAIPGYVSGGPNRFRDDPDAKRLIPEGTPPMKCYADDVACYSLNEVTIYWNSPTVFVLAALLGEE